MNTKILPLVAIMSGLLVGCSNGDDDSSSGGSGGGTTPSDKFTIEFISFIQKSESENMGNCSVFEKIEPSAAELALSGDAAESLLVYGVKASQGFKLLIHDSNGVVTETIDSSKYSNGSYSLDDDLVPDGGYFSVEEVYGGSDGGKESHILSVHKDYLQNLKVSIRNEQASNASCITGTQYTELDLNENAEVIVVSRQPTTTQAGMTSNISQLETLSTFNNYLSVQAEVPSENQILVTTFETLDSTDPDNLLAHDLNGFTFVHRDKIYDSVETPDFEESTNLSHDVTETSLSISSDLVLNSKSAIRVLNDDIYTWQPVYDSSSNYSFAANSSEIDSWELY